ncbi:odorant receptor 13a [Diachasma alloeum]|uniref:Odorant receptor n=1 Tax=Diachasma alloeum TaxID=454923 RepID=A0A4E0S4K7_9HYME|nr:odorant receptor 13a [Diachasma alloeum]THK33203.1 odorant receptor 198 [Diachasma alloeum]
MVDDELKEAKQLFAWNRMVFVIIGLWPLEPTICFFHTWLVYFAFHLFMGFADLVLVFGSLEEVVANVSETALESMIIVKMVVLKYSGTLREAVVMARDGIMEENFSETKEKEIYMFYNAIAKKFFRWAVAFAFISAILYHLKPMETRLKAALANDTVPLLLPYRSHLTFELTDMTTYILIYAYQSPMIYVHTFHTAAVCFLITLVLNACGHLAILARRIRRIEPNSSGNSELQLGNSVRRYLEIVRFSKLIDKSFWIILLEELVTTTVCLGLASYNVLVNADLADTTTFMTFVMYVFTMLLLIYGYCFAGEYLITESMNVHEAYYHCDWPDLPSSYRKSLTLCLIGTEKPLRLRAGGFYTFSMAGFTGIMKTAMAYVSMLRTLVL